MKPAELPQVANHSPSMPKKKGPPMETLDVNVRILTHPVRLSHPCEVEVRLTNRSPDAVLINRRLAVGYRDSVARELFVEVYKQGSDEVVSQKALLYQRNFSSPEDYVWLAPGQSIATSFDLFEWYSLPSAGEFELVVCYQADEPLAPKPDGLLSGTYCSERVAFNVIP
jgi:Uma2 family endonuclease